MEASLKILFITAFPPNQKTAGQDYTRRLLDDLVSRGHKISLFYADYPNHSAELDERIELLGTIHPYIKNCLFLPFLHPFFTRRFDKSVISFVQSAAKNFDMLYFDFSQVHLYSLFTDHPNKVLMCHDVICQKFTRKGRFFLPWIKHCEKKLLRSADKIITFSKKDSAVIKNEYGFSSTPVNFYLKNGHFDYYKENLCIQENLFCFYGAWNRAENTECLEWFFSEVYPNVRGDIEYAIIGGGMNNSLKRRLSSCKNIKILGFVENPVTEIAKCQALIAPLRKGAGVKVKVIDSLSCGTPVIGTDVAFEGIEDNSRNRLFYAAQVPCDYSSILNGWQNISSAQKQSAADEFFARYNTNHFADII